MAPSFEDILKSGQFTFRIGEEKYPITVHAAAIAATSDHMHVLINGGMKESEERIANIVDLTVEDFVRFCEFAYRGDYTVPAWELVSAPAADINQGASYENHEPPPPEPEYSYDAPTEDRPYEPAYEPPTEEPQNVPEEATAPESEPAPEIYNLGYSYGSGKKKFKGKKKGGWYEPPIQPVPSRHELATQRKIKFRQQFDQHNYIPDDDVKEAIMNGAMPCGNTAPDQNFGPVFLAHARLYTFAQIHLIESLQARVLEKLYRTLKGFHLYSNRITDVIALARYAYDNNHDRGEDGSMDNLRRLVVEYIACEADTISKSKEFFDLMEQGGEFVGDFWGIVKEFVV